MQIQRRVYIGRNADALCGFIKTQMQQGVLRWLRRRAGRKASGSPWGELCIGRFRHVQRVKA